MNFFNFPFFFFQINYSCNKLRLNSLCLFMFLQFANFCLCLVWVQLLFTKGQAIMQAVREKSNVRSLPDEPKPGIEQPALQRQQCLISCHSSLHSWNCVHWLRNMSRIWEENASHGQMWLSASWFFTCFLPRLHSCVSPETWNRSQCANLIVFAHDLPFSLFFPRDWFWFFKSLKHLAT